MPERIRMAGEANAPAGERDWLSANLLRLTPSFDLDPNGTAVFNYDTSRKTSVANSQVQPIA
jgi:hypothetical protein